MVVATIFASGATLFLMAALRVRRRTSLQILARMTTLDSSELARTREGRLPLWEQTIATLVRGVAARVKGRWSGVSSDDIRRAGVDPERVRPEDVLAVKVIGAIVAVGGVIALSTVASGAIILAPAAGFGGFVAPSLAIRRRIRRRRARILSELPDLIALLKAFVAAGIALEQALHFISAQQALASRSSVLATEIRAALSDYGLGVSIDSALESMARRVAVDELEMFVTALGQGKRQGAGMEQILRDQETVARLHQRNRVSAEASRVGTRLVGILVLVYLPEFLVLIMVPLFYGIFLRAFG